MWPLTFRVGNRRQKCDFGAARIEPRVLHDDRNVGFEYRGIVGVARDRLRVVEIIEAQVQRAAGGDGHAVRAGRLAVGEENGNRDARLALPGVENASGLVGDQRAVGKGAFGGNVTFGDCPSPASNGLHAVPPFFPLKMITRTARFSFRAAGTFFSVRRRGVVNGVLPGNRKMVARESADTFSAAQRERPQSETIQGQGCAQSPFRPAPPTRRGSRRSPNHRNPMGRFWCAPGRSACARPTAKSSRVVMVLLLPVSSASFSGTNRWAQSRPHPRVAASHPAISSSASCAGPILCRAWRARPESGTCVATAATPSAVSRSGTA